MTKEQLAELGDTLLLIVNTMLNVGRKPEDRIAFVLFLTEGGSDRKHCYGAANTPTPNAILLVKEQLSQWEGMPSQEGHA